MNINIPRTLLVSAIKSVRPFLPSRPVNPALGHLLLHLNAGWLSATAGDGTSFIHKLLKLEGEHPQGMSLLIDGALLEKLLTAQGDVVSLTPGESTCEVKIGRSKYKVGTLDASGYPSLDWGTDGLVNLCTAQQLRTGVDLVSDFAETKAEAGYMRCVYLVAENGTLDIVAGSTKAISVYRVPGIDQSLTLKLLVPAPDLKAFTTAINDDSDIVQVGQRGRFKYNSVDVSLATMDAQYMNYKAPLGMEAQAKLNVTKDVLQDAVGRMVNLYSDGQSRAVYIDMVPGDDDLKLSVVKAQLGTGEELVPANLAQGEFKGCGTDVVGLSRMLKSAPAGMLTLSDIGHHNFKMVSAGNPDWVVLWSGVAKN